jgi:hypothetical protein
MTDDTLIDQAPFGAGQTEQTIESNTHSPKIRKLMAEEAAQKQRTWSYYQTMKAKEPDKYWSPKVQQQLHNDAIALQEHFGFTNDNE